MSKRTYVNSYDEPNKDETRNQMPNQQTSNEQFTAILPTNVKDEDGNKFYFNVTKSDKMTLNELLSSVKIYD